MRIACLQFAPKVGDISNNITRADAVLSRTDPDDLENLDLLVLPEMALSGMVTPRSAEFRLTLARIQLQVARTHLAPSRAHRVWRQLAVGPHRCAQVRLHRCRRVPGKGRDSRAGARLLQLAHCG
jgi:predicted amidohydrolase